MMRDMMRLWASDPIFDEHTRREARRIMGSEEESVRCFGQELEFGTAGLRGVLGVGTNRMNRYTVARATSGLASYLRSTSESPAAVIGYDSRICSREFADATASVLAAHGVKGYVFDRLLPTPLVSYAVRALGCQAGVMITASHNPAEYNGYKVYGPDGCQMANEAADAVTACIRGVAYPSLRFADRAQAEAQGLIEPVPAWIYQSYIERTLACSARDIGEKALRLVYTPLNGTGREPVTDVFARIGLRDVFVVPEQEMPDGRFPTCEKPNPELPSALRLAIELARRERADLVLGTDPDCDRVGVAVRDAAGDYVILSGNEVGLLLMDYLLDARRAALTGAEVVVKTIVTSDLTFAIASEYGIAVREVLTGFKYIGDVIADLEGQGRARDFVLGFEESCGYLAGTHVRDKDAVMASMLIVEMADFYKAQGRTLLDQMQSLYLLHGFIASALVNVEIKDALPMRRMRQILADLRAHLPQTLAGAPIEAVKDYARGLDGLPPSDVLSFLTPAVKVIVRPSGTEPKVKLYITAKGAAMDRAEALCERARAEAEAWIG